MAAPGAMGGAGIGLSLIGGLIKGMGAASSADAESQMYSYRAGMARVNAKVNKENADFARAKGESDSVKYGMGAAQRQGQIITAQAASGLDVRSGSNKAVQESQSKVTRMDLDQIRANAAKTAYNYDVASSQDLAQAGLYDRAAANSQEAKKYAVAGSIIGTVSSVADKWMAGKSNGLWSLGGSGGDNRSLDEITLGYT